MIAVLQARRLRLSAGRLTKKRHPKKRGPCWQILDERSLYKEEIKHGWCWQSKSRQNITPVSNGLSKIIGVEKGSRILFFAGCYGNWAEALAKDGLKVVYSDVSREMVHAARKHTEGRVERYRVLEASQWPRRPNVYDWSISFEPIPLRNTGLPLALMRSLLNRKGAKIIYSTDFAEDAVMAGKIAEKIAQLYGASCHVKHAKVRDENKKELREIKIITLKTNREAQKKAWIDVQVLKAVRSEGKHSKREKRTITLRNLLQSERIKRLGISKEELEESLNRLEALVTSIGYLKNFSVDVESR